MPTAKTYRPIPERDGMQLTQMLADRAEPFTVSEWPYSTEDAGEQAALDAHPWVEGEDAPQPETAEAAVEPAQQAARRSSRAEQANSEQPATDEEGA